MDDITALSSWSGGKDSCLACYKAIEEGYAVKYLLNFISRESGRGCFHGIESRLMQIQADALGIPLIQEKVSADMQKYEEEFKAAVLKIKASGIANMVFGDIYLDEHKKWVERVCGEIKIRPVEPLWSLAPENIIREFVDSGFKAIVVSAKADLFGSEFLGRQVDYAFLSELKQKNICPCGENGEFHTFVIDGPIFRKRIGITRSKPLLKEGFWKHWFLDIEEYRLFEK